MIEYNYLDETSFTLSHFLSNTDCDRYLRIAEDIGFQDAPVNTNRGEVMLKEIRNNERVIWDHPETAERFWSIAKDFFLSDSFWRPVGLNERFRFYRYDVGQQFDWHRDGSFARENGERSRWTLLIYLNEDFEGGATTVGELDIQPQTGLALCFAHHRMHKGQPVLKGRKYVLRTDVMCVKNQT